MKKFIPTITIIFFISYAVIIFATFQDYGITWDEGDHNEYGKRVILYYSSGMTDDSAFKFKTLYLYGGLFDVAAELLKLVSPFGEYETRHLLNAVTGFFGVVGVFFFARYLTGSYTIGLLAAVLLVLTPRYYGHSFNNPKDIPFAAFYLWSVYLLAKAGYRWRSGEISKIADWKLGLAMGACMGIRPPGLVMMFYLILLFFAVRRLDNADGHTRLSLIQLVRTRLLHPVLVAISVMFIFWPYSHLNPIINIPHTIKLLSHFPWNFPLMFDGQKIMATDVPWNYILKWYGIATPLPHLAGFGLFLIFGAIRVFYSRTDKYIPIILILFSMAFPLGLSIVMQSTLYDGLRHFLFLTPLMAVSGAWGFFQLHKFIQTVFSLTERNELALKIVLLSVLTGGLTPVVKWNIRSHPHQYIFFNETIGGIRGAFGKYETDYYGNSERQAALWLNRFVEKQNLAKKILVCSYSNSEQTQYYLNSKYIIYNPGKRNINACDVFIANLRW